VSWHTAAAMLVARLVAGCQVTLWGLALCPAGYQVALWGRSPPAAGTALEEVRHVHGDAALATALPGARALVCLLPLTPALRGVLCADMFARLPRGAAVINAGRGALLCEADLVDALRSGACCAAECGLQDVPGGGCYTTAGTFHQHTAGAARRQEGAPSHSTHGVGAQVKLATPCSMSLRRSPCQPRRRCGASAACASRRTLRHARLWPPLRHRSQRTGGALWRDCPCTTLLIAAWATEQQSPFGPALACRLRCAAFFVG
jgi:D-isomer specific 2-hydroxyacid dehydrogenase, NAD binding domain